MIHLNVWLTLPDNQRIQIGELGVTDPDIRHGGKLAGAFRYAPEYLNHPQAFALDPVQLPLLPQEFPAQRPEAGVHAVFEDSLPDAWGRRVMVRRYNLARLQQRVPHLLKHIGANALGALAYADAGTSPVTDRITGVSDLTAIVEAALRFDAGQVTQEDDLALLFQACSSPGGARPKALVSDAGRQWIAKFPSLRDTFALVPLEAATMQLAHNAGILVPETRLALAGSRYVLLVERFDISPTAGQLSHAEPANAARRGRILLCGLPRYRRRAAAVVLPAR
jgi:serine/threonine-protein kinase HipA